MSSFQRLTGRTALALTILALSTAFPVSAAPVSLTAKFNSAYGWVKPGETYPFFVNYSAGATGATSVTIHVTLPLSAIYLSSTPAAVS